jgi:hypothetical protein
MNSRIWVLYVVLTAACIGTIFETGDGPASLAAVLLPVISLLAGRMMAK